MGVGKRADYKGAAEGNLGDDGIIVYSTVVKVT